MPESAWKLVFYTMSWSYSTYLLFFTSYTFFYDPPSVFYGETPWRGAEAIKSHVVSVLKVFSFVLSFCLSLPSLFLGPLLFLFFLPSFFLSLLSRGHSFFVIVYLSGVHIGSVVLFTVYLLSRK